MGKADVLESVGLGAGEGFAENGLADASDGEAVKGFFAVVVGKGVSLT